jgi:hypothetical protein
MREQTVSRLGFIQARMYVSQFQLCMGNTSDGKLWGQAKYAPG